LAKACRKKRDERYASAVDMREAFRVASSHQPGDAATIIGAEGAALANAKTVCSIKD